PQRLVDRYDPRLDRLDEVDVQQVAPQHGARRRGDRDQIVDVQRRVGVGVPARLESVGGVAVEGAIGRLVYAIVACALLVVLTPEELARPPCVDALDGTGLDTPDALEDLGEQLASVILLDESDAPARDGFEERGMATFDAQAHRARRDAVPEPAVDAALRRVQDRERLPSFGGVVELRALDCAEDPATAVCREYRDPADGGRGQEASTRHRELEGVQPSGADDLVAVEGRERPVELDARPVELEARRLEPLAERGERRHRELGQLVARDRSEHELGRHVSCLADRSRSRPRFLPCLWRMYGHASGVPDDEAA